MADQRRPGRPAAGRGAPAGLIAARRESGGGIRRFLRQTSGVIATAGGFTGFVAVAQALHPASCKPPNRLDAMASAAPTDTETASPAAAPAPKRGVGMMLAMVLLSTLGAGGAAYFVVGKSKPHEEEEAKKKEEAEGPVLPAPASYLALDPAFIVNLESADEARYLQVEVQLMSRDAIALEAAKVHLPLIRNSLVMLFGQQVPSDLASRSGKEHLQQAALAEVQKVLQAETGKPVVEAVYFTSFVMQ